MAEIDSSNSNGDIAEDIADAVESLEDATAQAFAAAVDSGDIERAERIASAVIEGMRRAVADIEDAAEHVEEAAEEVAENAPTEEAADAAEDAVEAARDAQDAAEDAEESIREEVREHGGGDVTEAAAVDEVIHVEAEEAEEAAPIEVAPAIDANEAVEQMVADEAAVAEDKPPLIQPEAAHPYYKKRSVKVFGKTINL